MILGDTATFSTCSTVGVSAFVVMSTTGTNMNRMLDLLDIQVDVERSFDARPPRVSVEDRYRMPRVLDQVSSRRQVLAALPRSNC